MIGGDIDRTIMLFWGVPDAGGESLGGFCHEMVLLSLSAGQSAKYATETQGINLCYGRDHLFFPSGIWGAFIILLDVAQNDAC